MRQIVGTNNVDHRDGGDVAALSTGIPSLAAVMQPQYGPPPQYDVIMLVGVDPSEEAPILDPTSSGPCVGAEPPWSSPIRAILS
ncbi:MAG: hypothetical protein H6642_13745 [Caldilineaceae bacterium]|nr:hypothetical protein [Caldilineaceae bacterium]